MKVALCFWGLTRSLKFTLDSIHKHIIRPLRKSHIEFKIFLHTYEFESDYYNPRAKEVHIKLDFQEYKLLKPDYVQIDNQDDVKKKLQLDKYRSHPDPWGTNYITVDNFICAMYSKKRLGEMIQNSGEDFDAFIFLRPDVKFVNSLDTQYLLNIQNERVYIPNFHLFPDFNDRFLICPVKHVFTYTNLFDDMLEFSKHLSLHSERFQFAVLTQKYKLFVVYIPIHFNRVRACGRYMRDYQPEKYRKTNNAIKFDMKFI
jgi:hypothetical protein